MGPYRVVISTLRLSIAGIDDKHLIHLAILIPVVFREVYSCGFSSIYGLAHHLCRTQVIIYNLTAVILLRFTIVSHFFAQRIRSVHIEIDGQLVVALLFEIVTHRAFHTRMAITFLIKKVSKGRIRVVRDKLHILKLHKKNQAAVISRCR